MNTGKITLGNNEYNVHEDDIRERERFENQLATARDENEKNGGGCPWTANEKYIITDIMKLPFEQVKNYDKTKLVKRVKRRELLKKSTILGRDDEGLSKAINYEYPIFGRYIGSTTAAERNRNKEMQEANDNNMTVRQWRLYKNGIRFVRAYEE